MSPRTRASLAARGRPFSTGCDPQWSKNPSNPHWLCGGNYLRVEKFFAFWLTIRMLHRIPISTPAERRIRREARSAALRAQALALRRSGTTYAEIGDALGVSLERAR